MRRKVDKVTAMLLWPLCTTRAPQVISWSCTRSPGMPPTCLAMALPFAYMLTLQPYVGLAWHTMAQKRARELGIAKLL